MDKIIVSVLLPMYNASLFIQDAVESILVQTFPYFELVIIDDASTDNSLAIVKNIEDERIVIIKKQKNTGYTDSLNYGLTIAKGKFIARMDADDISMPERLEIQVNFLNKNPDIILCGSWFRILNSNETVKHPITHAEISIALLDYCAIGHPTVMFRKEEFIKNNLYYDKNMEPAEDHDLWVRAIRIGKLQNIPNVLLKYRLHNNQVSVNQKAKQEKHSSAAKKFHLGCLYEHDEPVVDVTESPILKDLTFTQQKKIAIQYLHELKHLKNKNNSFNIFDEKGFDFFCLQKKSAIIKEWFDLSAKSSIKHLFAFINPFTAYYCYFSNRKKINLILRYLNPFNW